MRQRLSKAAVVQAGLDVLDEAGIDGVTVRAVASRLGVQAPALYWHVRDKQDLLDEMATEIWRRVSAELTALPDAQPWDQAMAAFAAITRRALLSHRDGAKVFSGTYLTDASVLEAQEERLAQTVQQGFALADVIRAYSLLYSFTVGFCVEEQAVAQAATTGDDRYSPARRAERLNSRTHPLVLQAGPEIFGDPDMRFADLVVVIIDTASRMRTSSAPTGTAEQLACTADCPHADH
jgi:TetR/AcrR family transcriptional regulator, tetracycline repressor protein